MHKYTPPLLRRSVSSQWWTPPAEPCRYPWGQRQGTWFPSSPPASRKGTSWCRRHKNTPDTRRNRGIRPDAGAWEARDCPGHRQTRWLWKRRRRKLWGWKVCPCPWWGGWRAGRPRSTRPRCHCHARYRGRTWEKEGTGTTGDQGVEAELIPSVESELRPRLNHTIYLPSTFTS